MEETAGRTSRELHPRQIGSGKNALPDQHLQRAGVNAPGPPSNFPLRWTEPVVRLRGHRRRRETIKRLLFTANEAKNCWPPPLSPPPPRFSNNSFTSATLLTQPFRKSRHVIDPPSIHHVGYTCTCELHVCSFSLPCFRGLIGCCHAGVCIRWLKKKIERDAEVVC